MPAPMQCFLAADVLHSCICAMFPCCRCSGIPALVHACIHAAIPCSRCGGVQASQSLLKAVQVMCNHITAVDGQIVWLLK